jgi:isocitrate lyase
MEGKSSAELQQIEDKWTKDSKLALYVDVVAQALVKAGKAASVVEHWKTAAQEKSHADAKSLAKSLGVDPYWNWDAPRTREGYYRYQGGTKCGVRRGIAFAPYADLLWMETAKPILKQAQEFAHGVHAVYPHQMLAYNLSPSFNWDAAGMTDAEIRNFIAELGKLGFVWQFITLAGFHADALVVDTFARDYAQRGMLAYVQNIQRKEREHGVETLAHQKWSGAYYVDGWVNTVQGGLSSTAAMGKGATEDQFK